jgi:hypothetical protein
MESKVGTFGHIPFLMKKQRINRVDNSLPLYNRHSFRCSAKYS